MVQDVMGIHPQLDGFAFTNLERLAHCRIEQPEPDAFHGCDTKISALSRHGMAEDNQGRPSGRVIWPGTTVTPAGRGRAKASSVHRSVPVFENLRPFNGETRLHCGSSTRTNMSGG